MLLVEKGAGLFSTVLRYGNGTEKQLPAATPAKDLIAAAEIDYQEYRREIRYLRKEHPLFEDRLDISVADFEDFVAEALLLPSMLQKTDPVSFFVLGELLHQSLQTEDDGSASFLLNAAAELLYILEDPVRVQTCLRNVFEMTFDGMERARQRERYEKLCQVYPDIGRLCDPAALSDVEPGHSTPPLDCGFWSWRSIFSRIISALPDVITAGAGLSRRQKRSPGTVTG